MKRLVYAPKVWVYVKGKNNQVYDLSDYIVSGSVERRINEVSSATVVLRNPDRVFTQLGAPAFLPMDPITIFLQRHIDTPVRVFTGWIDESPYYQMKPGVCTIKASCTLKKLQYTFWDPALPFVNSLLTSLGWQVDTSNGILSNPQAMGGGPLLSGSNVSTANSKAGSAKSAKKQQIQDGSMGQLLYTILNLVGGWSEQNIYIENLPPDLTDWIAKLYIKLNEDNGLTPGASTPSPMVDQVSKLLGTIIGTGSLAAASGTSLGTGTGAGTSATGSGVGSTGSVTNHCDIINTLVSQANSFGLPPLFVVQVWNVEGAVTDCNPNSSNARGYFQFTSADPYPGIHVNYPHDACDLGLASKFFCQAAKAKLNGNPSYANQSNWETWAEQTQQPGVGAYSSYWGARLPQSQGWIDQCKGKATTTPIVTHSTNSPTATVARVGGTSSSGGSGGPTGGGQGVTTPSRVINPIPGFSVTAHDAGIDATAPVGSAILAPADSTLCQVQSNWFAGQPLLEFSFDNNMPGAMSQYWYVSEQITPVSTTKGTKFKQGQAVAHFAASGTGIEIGWGDTGCGGNGTLAGQQGHGDFSHQASPTSNSFVSYFGVGGGTPTGISGSPGSGTSGSTGASSGGGGGGLSSDQVFQIAKGVVFGTELQWPTLADTLEAVSLQGHKSLMNDKPLLSFVQQLASATMRSFMSAPNGDFFAFFPDYFGEFNHRVPYWNIHDIEILTGDIQLTDASLCTHMYVVGDILNSGSAPDASTKLLEKIISAGTVDIYDFFDLGLAKTKTNDPIGGGIKTGGYVDPAAPVTTTTGSSANGGWGRYWWGGHRNWGTSPPTPTTPSTPLASHDSLHNKTGVDAFLARYGARPVEQDQPLIRSSYFEAFVALQYFMMAWSQQWATDFTFTFMPELYPGGRVSFDSQNITMFINTVVHTFDYENGFTTTAELSAPAATKPDSTPEGNDISWGMVNSLRPGSV